MEQIASLADFVMLWPLWLGVAVAFVILWLTRHADPFRSGQLRRPVQTDADRVEMLIRDEIVLRSAAAQGQAGQDFSAR